MLLASCVSMHLSARRLPNAECIRKSRLPCLTRSFVLHDIRYSRIEVASSTSLSRCILIDTQRSNAPSQCGPVDVVTGYFLKVAYAGINASGCDVGSSVLLPHQSAISFAWTIVDGRTTRKRSTHDTRRSRADLCFHLDLSLAETQRVPA